MGSCFGKDFSFQISWKIREGFSYYVNRGMSNIKCRFMPDFGLLIYDFSSGYRALLLLLRYLIDSNGRANIEKLQYL